MTFFITLSYMVIYVIYCHQLPFYLIRGGAPRQIQPILPHSNKKCLGNFFSRPGVHLHPCTPLGYACDYAHELQVQAPNKVSKKYDLLINTDKTEVRSMMTMRGDRRPRTSQA